MLQYWQSLGGENFFRRNLICGLICSVSLHLAVLVGGMQVNSWLIEGRFRTPDDSVHIVRMQILPYMDVGGGQGGGEGGGALDAPLPKEISGEPIPIPEALAVAETLQTTPQVSPAIDSANAGGAGLPGSSWGSGGTGWGTGRGSGVGLGRVFVSLPRPLLETIPEYPVEARKAKAQGIVELNVKIDATGKVVNVMVLRNTTENVSCAQSAIAAAYRSRYQPALTSAGPDTAWVVRQYRFSLNE